MITITIPAWIVYPMLALMAAYFTAGIFLIIKLRNKGLL